ncbi:MAG TPA: hypothetical protein VHC42_04700 [Rhizomicrobium sp.]|nr:hypothetical protein [Rhizomicrobium sp.]
MSADSSHDGNSAKDDKGLPATRARQGKTGTGARYVLALSTTAAVLGLAILYLVFFGL